ncbi:MAG: FHA domain-containing protein [Planctomycetota bacterium]|nr:MAG: FHA domain-containing protein [Planctomycetota bacterium]REJ91131.1 MAG: FHA domain-containing protein [Planctomycetota bacterium]REK28906.1 MAG: FHA domain-containing protein [Planctomycetota bacterium]REK39660.1 MAG: FHA domain-containing protein [Planctomycetota bacterium]
MSRLVMLQGGEATPYELDGEEVVLGRLPECDIQLQSNMVSRKHARVVRSANSFVLEDLGSGNGSFVNGKRISEPVTLQHDDRIKLGPVLLRFETDDGEDSSAVKEVVDDAFRFDVTADDASSTIMGTVGATGGFGLLDVQPQAKLKAVLDISRSLVGTHDIDSLLPKVLDSLFEIFPHADRGCILLKEESSGKMVPRVIKHRRESDDDSVKVSRTILKQVLEQKQAILSADAASDARFQASESISALTIRSMMCVPMLSLEGEPTGVINIDTQNPMAQFKPDDLDLMVAVAGQAAMSYESARLLASHVEKQKQDAEMDIARSVQRALLPEEMPHCDGYEFFASYEAAQAVGGDYYDVIELPDGRIVLAFGDVAGKGVPASLVMSRLSSAVRNIVEYVEDPAEAVARINDHMCAKAVEGRFVTFVLVVLNPAQHTFSIVNAGHMSPMIRRASGEVEELDESTVGVPVGVVEGFPFEAAECSLGPGDCAVIYTDGVSEAMNHESELYGLERLREFVAASSGRVLELGPALREDVRRHAAGRPQNDDITVMIFGRTPA